MNPGFQLGDVVSVVSERPLGDDLPAVERRIDIVDRHTEDLDAVFQRLFDGMRPAECRQQRRVDVDDPSAVSPQQHVADDAHVPRQADQLHAGLVEPPHDLALVVGLRGILFRGEYECLDPVPRSPLHNPGAGFVADHQHHPGRDLSPLAGRGDSLEVRAAAAGKDRKASHGLSGLRHPRCP